MDAVENVGGASFLGFGVEKPTFFAFLVLFVGMASMFLLGVPSKTTFYGNMKRQSDHRTQSS